MKLKKWPHQIQALKAIRSEFKKTDRTKLLMACGTGKTEVAIWLSEVAIRLAGASSYRKIVFLFPSIQLLSQTYLRWQEQTELKSTDYQAICVCSDPTVGSSADDRWEIDPKDYGMTVTTDSQEVQAFLKNPAPSGAKKKLVFSTYQSSEVLADLPFDLGIFDEAHRTAGKVESYFSFALLDHHIPIKKRLFMTATPRHYNIKKKEKEEGEGQLVFSMDTPVYGTTAFDFSFRKAVKAGVICDLLPIIAIVTSGEMQKLIRKGKIQVRAGQRKTDIRNAAHAVAIEKCQKKYGIRKVFTFHNRIQKAKDFASAKSEKCILDTILPGVWHDYIFGAMPVKERNRLLQDFEAAPRGVLSNARCLIEGVNIPAVDMISFPNTKRSRNEIVQATGRATRKHGKKKRGYVLLPVYVEKRTRRGGGGYRNNSRF